MVNRGMNCLCLRFQVPATSDSGAPNKRFTTCPSVQTPTSVSVPQPVVQLTDTSFLPPIFLPAPRWHRGPTFAGHFRLPIADFRLIGERMEPRSLFPPCPDS